MRGFLVAACGVLVFALSACSSENGAGNKVAAQTSPGEALDTLKNADGLSTTAELLKRAGLDGLFRGPGSYTIFAPADEAFRALPEDERKALESEEGRPQLVALLRQHMAPGYFGREDMAKALADGNSEVSSLGAAPIQLRKEGDAILLGTGDTAPRVLGEPVIVGNSIVHRIDRVLPPPAG